MSSPPNLRRQLTLFVAGPWASPLGAVRRALDPVQASLIAAHVTLCREDEIEGIDPSKWFARVQSWRAGPICLSFGPPERFLGHGVLLPCVHGLGGFQRLRRWLLDREDVREHRAHMTLAHPRNPRSAGNTDAALLACPKALELELASVALIEQRDAEPWRLVQQATLGSGVA